VSDESSKIPWEYQADCVWLRIIRYMEKAMFDQTTDLSFSTLEDDFQRYIGSDYLRCVLCSTYTRV
jgi:hypothetical protein